MRLRSRHGFTLLEVIVALGILAVGLMVLVDTQATSLFMVTDTDKTTTATMLAQEKMTEAMLELERDGWSSMDIEEEGVFEDFGNEEFRGESLHLDATVDYSEFHYAFTVRKIELNLPSDMGSMADQMTGAGYYGDDQSEQIEESDVSAGMDLGDFGISPDMITEYLGDFIREVRVIVWWGENEDETDQIELVHHVINPSGALNKSLPGGL